MRDFAIKSKKILVVDDEPDLREVMTFVMSEMGFDVIEASGGNKALKLIQSESVHLVISDVRMPDGNGIDLCKNIRALNLKPAIILVTGFSDLTPEMLDALGVQALVNKPFSLEDLGKLAKKLLISEEAVS